jgi:phosphoribosylglycinamide formyltransferase-1
MTHSLGTPETPETPGTPGTLGTTGRRLRLGVLVSGGGRTLEYLVIAAREGRLHGDVVRCIASSARCAALERAARLAVPVAAIRPRDHATREAFASAVFADLEAHGVELALFGGYLVKLDVPPAWRGRVMNIHPSLLPAFGGQGFYGHHVHDAVLRAGVKVTGCTVHFVDDEYDHGPIIAQRCVEVLPGDDADSLAARVFAAERETYVDAINRYATGRLVLEHGKVRETRE